MGALVRRNSIARHSPLIWTTAEGERIPITQMETRHLFNAMKMVFNHLASMHGGQVVWFNHEYCDFTTAALTAPQRLARMVVAMLRELDRRNDLPAKYIRPLVEIRRQLPEQRRLTDGRENSSNIV